jgi:hypothetical protein
MIGFAFLLAVYFRFIALASIALSATNFLITSRASVAQALAPIDAISPAGNFLGHLGF